MRVELGRKAEKVVGVFRKRKARFIAYAAGVTYGASILAAGIAAPHDADTTSKNLSALSDTFSDIRGINDPVLTQEKAEEARLTEEIASLPDIPQKQQLDQLRQELHGLITQRGLKDIGNDGGNIVSTIDLPKDTGDSTLTFVRKLIILVSAIELGGFSIAGAAIDGAIAVLRGKKQRTVRV